LKDQIGVKAAKQKLAVGKTADMKLTLPKCLRKASNLSDKTPSDAIGNVTVAYKSSASSIASIGKNGKITARGAGTARITATVRLYNGTVKTFNIKITVK
jgi:Bacterial Ig-like domain (group 2).